MTEQRKEYDWTSLQSEEEEGERGNGDSPEGEGPGDTMRIHLEQRKPHQYLKHFGWEVPRLVWRIKID